MEDKLWVRYGTVGDYVVWRSDDIFNITDGDEPRTSGGYHHLESLLKLKGLRLDDVALHRTAAPVAAYRI
jgi:hypothetical protein